MSDLLTRANNIATKYHLRAELLPVHSVGVQGDERTYRPVVVLIGPFPGWDIIEKVSSELTNTLELNRVTYQI